MLRQIGAYIARQQMNDAADLLLEGDGSEGSEGITMKSLTAARPTTTSSRSGARFPRTT